MQDGAASEELVRALIDSLQDMVFTTDAEGRFTGVHGRAFRSAGLKVEDFLGRTPMEVNGVESRELHAKALAKLQTGRPVRYEWPQGDRVYQTSATPHVAADGRVVGIVAVRSDVTDLRRADRESMLQRRALEAAANGIVIVDAAGTIQWVNHAVVELTGYSRRELFGRNPRIFKSGTQPEEYYRDLWNTVSAGSVWRGDIVNRRKDGSLYTEDMTITPVRDRTGAVTHYIAIKQDVTERVRARDALERSEAWWRAVLENGSEIVGVDDANGTFRYLSPAVERVLGYEPEELIGTSGFELVHPEDLARIRAGFADKAIQPGANAPVVMRYRHKDGSWRVLEATSTNAIDHPYVQGMIVNAHDVTERTELEAHRALLESVITHARDGIIVMDADPWPNGKRIRYANPAFLEMTGYAMDEILGENPRTFQGHPEDPAELERIRATLARGESVRSEFTSVTKDGRAYLVEIDVAPIFDDAGRVTHYVSVQRDITERRVQEARMERFRQFRVKLADLAEEALAGTPGHAFFQKALDFAIEVLPGSQAGCLLLRQEDRDFRFAAVRGFARELTDTTFPSDVILGGLPDEMPVIVRGYRPEQYPNPATRDVLFGPLGRAGEIRSTLKVPLWIGSDARGVISLDNFESADAFDQDSVEMGRLFGRSVATILQRLDLEGVLDRQASTDPLTGLANRRRAEEMLRHALDRAGEDGVDRAVALVDVDNFTSINDSHGHVVGDALIRRIGERLVETAGPDAMVARWNGDEFLVMLPGAVTAPEAEEAGLELATALAAPFRIQSATIAASATVGLAVYPQHAATVPEIIDSVHIALHEAKRRGRGAVVVFDPEMGRAVARRTQLERGLREAIARGDIELHYQPRVGLRPLEVRGAEALARWTHPELGPVSPGEFIPIAEQTGLILPLGEQVLERAAGQAKAWLDAGVPLVVSANVSLVQLRDEGFAARVAEILRRHDLPGRWLELEVTESAAMSDVDSTIDVLNAVKALGVRISIDDFGTAYSSLAHLKLLPIDTLKIDRSFVRDLAEDPAHAPSEASIAQAIIALGKGLGLRVVAEGVETPGQMRVLQMLGCDEAQGYLFGKAVPPAEFAARNLSG